MKMRKILFLLPSRALSGGILVVRQHAKLLAEKGYEVTVAYLHASDLDGDPVFSTIEPAREVLQSQLDEDVTYDAAVATWWETAYYLARVKARSYFYFVQGFEERLYPADSVWPLLVQRTYQTGFHYIAVNTGLQRYLQQNFGQSAVVIPPGINLGEFDCEPAITRNAGNTKLRVLVEGSPSAEYKRVGLAFEALSCVADLETVYVSPEGNGKAEWNADYFFSRVPYAKMPSIYKSCDLILKLSTDETFSMPVLESFAAGATAIVAEFHGGSDFIRDGENALVVPNDDIAAVVQALEKLQADSQLLTKLKAGAKATANQYLWTDLSARMEEALLTRFASGTLDPPPLAGCLPAFEAAHAMRLELAQSKIDNENLLAAHAQISQLLAAAQNEVALLRASRAYRVGNSLARVYRKIKRPRVDK